MIRKIKYLGVDTEGTGLDPYHGCQAYIITTCDERGKQTWWETRVNPLTRRCKFPTKDLIQVKKHLLAHDVWYFQNPVFDITFLYMAGCSWILNYWSRVRDIGIASHLIHSGFRNKNLAALALHYLEIDIFRLEEKLKKEVQRAQNWVRRNLPEWRVVPTHGEDPMLPSGGGWKADMWILRELEKVEKFKPKEIDAATLHKYHTTDAAVTVALGRHIEQLIESKDLWKIYEERLMLLPVIYAMQCKAITLNGDRTKSQKKKYDEESVKHGKRCVALAKRVGVDLVLPKAGNNKSLLKTVFEGFGLEPVEVSSKTGEPSLKSSVIEHYMSDLPPGSAARRFLINLKEKRSRDTASGTYLTGYMKAWLPIKGVKGYYKLHSSINPTGTGTLRWVSYNPNQQNVSKKEGFNLRFCFGPAPRREWWSADAQNIELRIPAYESGEKELIDLFERPNDPPYYGSEHLLNFSTVYPDIWEKELKAVGFEKVGPHCKKKYASTWYQWCKNGGFAVGYGAVLVEQGDRIGTADKAFHRPGSHAKLKERFSRKEKLNRKCIEFAQEHGYIETVPDKTVDPEKGYPLECPFNKWGKVKPTIPLNYRTQGTAMWWMGKAMVRCHRYLDQINRTKYGMNTVQILDRHLQGEMLDKGYFLIIQVHDELVFDFPKGKGKKPWKTNLPIMKKLKELMQRGGDDIGIPTPVSVEYHAESWSVGETIKIAAHTAA